MKQSLGLGTRLVCYTQGHYFHLLAVKFGGFPFHLWGVLHTGGHLYRGFLFLNLLGVSLVCMFPQPAC